METLDKAFSALWHTWRSSGDGLHCFTRPTKAPEDNATMARMAESRTQRLHKRDVDKLLVVHQGYGQKVFPQESLCPSLVGLVGIIDRDNRLFGHPQSIRGLALQPLSIHKLTSIRNSTTQLSRLYIRSQQPSSTRDGLGLSRPSC